MKIVFMGTPEFAAPALLSLISSHHEVIAVYSKPPKPSGRGQGLSKSHIHNIAEKNGLTVFTPHSLKPSEEVQNLLDLNPDIIVVAAYGLILRSEVLSIPKHGCINIHPSNLPRWRGAAPIQRTILSGDKESAMCIMRMDEGLDTGDVIIRKKVTITDDMTATALHDYMADLGANMLIEAISQIEAGTTSYKAQSEEGATYADKLSTSDMKINFNQTSYMVNCQIRAFSTKPAAYFTYMGEDIKVIAAEYTTEKHDFPVGTVVDSNLNIACLDGFIRPTLLQRPSRKMIYTEAFLRGFPINQGSNLQGQYQVDTSYKDS